MRWATTIGLALVACTASTPEPAQPSKPPIPVAPLSDSCEQPMATYLAERSKLNYCEEDDDCAELPGCCPHGPYYIHREADIEPVLALERELLASCAFPECEVPELGIAHCEQGTCVPGRKPALDRRERRRLRRVGIVHMDCWDYRETWLEADDEVTTSTSSMIQGITPMLAIAPASEGVLTLEVDWPASCSDCRLWATEQARGMAEHEGVRSETERDGQPVVRERFELPVRRDEYRFMGMSATATDFTIRVELRDREGQPGRVTRHGVGWQRMCEG